MNRKNMALVIHSQRKRSNLARYRTLVGPLCAIIVFIALRSAFGSLGETEDQFNERYGNGKVTKLDAASRMKEVEYHSQTDKSVSVRFIDGKAAEIQYYGASDMTDAYIESCLNNNRQGHKWELINLDGDSSKRWQRDDMVRAEERPYVTSTGVHAISLTISLPLPIYIKPEEPPLIYRFAKGLGICVLIGLAAGGICWFIPFVLEKIADHLPKKRDGK